MEADLRSASLGERVETDPEITRQEAAETPGGVKSAKGQDNTGDVQVSCSGEAFTRSTNQETLSRRQGKILFISSSVYLDTKGDSLLTLKMGKFPSSNVLLCLTNSPKPNNKQFIIIKHF